LENTGGGGRFFATHQDSRRLPKTEIRFLNHVLPP
jgi:hypothetical protein